MAGKIYNLFLIRRMTERWLRLAPDDQQALLSKIDESLTATGGRRVVACDAYWCDEAYRGFGVEEFPDFDAWRRYADMREQLDWYSYVDSWSLLGTWHETVNPAEAVAPEAGKIYQLFIIRNQTEAYEQFPQPAKDAVWAKVAETLPDAKWVVAANCYWSSEEYQGFGIMAYADIDAIQRHFANLEQIGWPRYMRARTLLGTLWSA